MKIFQILYGLTHADFSSFGSIKNIPKGTFPKALLDQLVEAPDYVFLSWGYIDGKFIKPETPDGYKYDNLTGTFYPVGTNLLATIQHQTYGVTHEAVDKNIITAEIFKEITSEEYIGHNKEEK